MSFFMKLRGRDRTERWPAVALAVATAALLIIDAVVHLRDAGLEEAAPPGHIGEPELFRAEAVVALVAAAALLLWRRPLTWALALVVAGSAAAAVLVTTYVDIGPVGPIVDLYEPTWDEPGKLASAVAELLATACAAAGLIDSLRRRRPRRADST